MMIIIQWEQGDSSMRYAETRKQETHDKLVGLAGRALREKGPDQLGVAELMRSAGLTHGGFYAHFKSKDALLAEALENAFAHSGQRVRQVTAGMPARQALATYVDWYVSAAHRDEPATGCPIVALNSDLPRQSRKFRAVFGAGVKSLLGMLAAWIEEAELPDAEALAASLLPAMAGAVAIARAVPDQPLSDALLASARNGIRSRLGLPAAAGLGGIAR
jgi:TetR/AcrR family transcriptional regulator, transcriptional repressor for nem operon